MKAIDWTVGAHLDAHWESVHPRLLPELHAIMRQSAEIKPERGEQDALVTHGSPRRKIPKGAGPAPAKTRFQISLDETVIWEPAGRETWRIVLPFQVLRKLEEIAYVPELPCASPHGGKDGEGERDEERIANRLAAVAREIEALGHWSICGTPTAQYFRWLSQQYRALYKCYYTLTAPKSNAVLAARDGSANLRENWEERLAAAEGGNAHELAWACRLALTGSPKRISSFYVKPLFSLRKANGEFIRVIELRTENDKTYLLELTGEEYSAPSYLRKTLNTRGGGSWLAGERELQQAMVDWGVRLEWNEVEEVSVFGWHPGSRAWFFDDCAIDFRGGTHLPDSHGVLRIPTPHGKDGVRTRRFRVSELDKDGFDFYLGRVGMRPVRDERGQVQRLDRTSIAAFFAEFLGRAHDIVGGWDAFMGIGLVLAYAAAPEIFKEHEAFPGLWLHGEARQGKSSFARWLGKFWGIRKSRSLTSSTGAGAETMLQQYSNLPLVLDEAQTFMKDQVRELLKDCFGRIPSAKRVENLREILTAPIVMGVATSASDQTRSRYAHILVASQRRMPRPGTPIEGYLPFAADPTEGPLVIPSQGNWSPEDAERVQAANYDWIVRPRPEDPAREDELHLFGRFALEHRTAFSEHVMKRLRTWLRDPATSGLDERAKLVHGVALAGLSAMLEILGVQTVRAAMGPAFFDAPRADFEEMFELHLIISTREAVKAVQEQADLDVFWNDVLTGFQRGAFGEDWSEWKTYFKAIGEDRTGPPGSPQESRQTEFMWKSWTLHLQPDAVFSALKEWKRGQGETIALRKGDTASQLSSKPYWFKRGKESRQRFGASTMLAWSVSLDVFPELGYTPVTDETFEVYLSKTGPSRLALEASEAEAPSDPRCGALIQLCEQLTAAKAAVGRTDRGGR